MALAGLTPAFAEAAALADLDVAGLAERADRVDIGLVGKPVLIVDEAQRRVFTETEIVVERTLLGPATTSITLSQYGGRKGPVRTQIPGDVVLTEGDRVLLFTFKNEADNKRYLVNLAMGAWRISSAKSTVPPEQLVAEQDILVPVFGEGGLKPAPGRREVTIAEVIEAIRVLEDKRRERTVKPAGSAP